MLIQYHRIDPPAFILERDEVTPPRLGDKVELNGQRFLVGDSEAMPDGMKVHVHGSFF